MPNEDLWGFDALPLPETKSPAEILKEQARLFNTKMSGSAIYAEVKGIKSLERDKLSFSFDLVVPVLGDYRLRVLRCSFSVSNNYPVKVFAEFGNPDDGFGAPDVAEDQFIECLRSIFSDARLRSSIASLIANARV